MTEHQSEDVMIAYKLSKQPLDPIYSCNHPFDIVKPNAETYVGRGNVSLQSSLLLLPQKPELPFSPPVHNHLPTLPPLSRGSDGPPDASTTLSGVQTCLLMVHNLW